MRFCCMCSCTDLLTYNILFSVSVLYLSGHLLMDVLYCAITNQLKTVIVVDLYITLSKWNKVNVEWFHILMKSILLERQNWGKVIDRS